jgi:uncharacterized membrane protein
MKTNWASWRANFFAGLAVVLPAVLSVALLVWIFRNVANLTDTLLLFVPRSLTHEDNGAGPMHWYWSLVALVVALILITLVGQLARNYMGRKMIQFFDAFLLQIPLLNKVYSAIKQINEAFTSSNKSSFKHVVLVEFPRTGQHAVGFITSEEQAGIQTSAGEKRVGVFIPTTPNPTSGFLVLMPEREITRLDMSVADGIKFVMSLGSIAPEHDLKSPSAQRPL